MRLPFLIIAALLRFPNATDLLQTYAALSQNLQKGKKGVIECVLEHVLIELFMLIVEYH